MGNGTVNSPVSSPQVTVPVMVSNSGPGGPINNPLQVTCGYAFGAALATNGTVWTWGNQPEPASWATARPALAYIPGTSSRPD